MEALNGKMNKMDDEQLPPGFRFHPTDEELVSFYLNKKIVGSSSSWRAITEVDLNKCEPRDLPDGNEKEKELVIRKSLNGKPCKSKYDAKCDEKPPQIVNLKTSPRRIQQPR